MYFFWAGPKENAGGGSELIYLFSGQPYTTGSGQATLKDKAKGKAKGKYRADAAG